MTKRVSVTPAAEKVIDDLRGRFGELMFHQSGGCCDGSSPMCFEKGEFKVGSNDVYLGDVDGCGFFMSSDQFEYWQHTKLTMDIVPGRGSRARASSLSTPPRGATPGSASRRDGPRPPPRRAAIPSAGGPGRPRRGAAGS